MSLLRTGFFSSTANVLKSSPKILHVKNRDFFQFNWLGSNQSLWSRCCHTDLNGGSARLRCCFSKGPLKRDFLDIYMTIFLEVVISEIQNVRVSSFFSKYLKFNLDFENPLKNWGKVFCFRDNCVWIGIIKLSLLRRGYLSFVRNVLTSCPKISMSIRETFSNSIDLSVINEYDKGAVMQIWTVLAHVYHLLVEGWYEMGSFKTFIWPRFRSPYFRKYKIYPGQLFFRNIWNLLRISKIQQKIEKRFLFLR